MKHELVFIQGCTSSTLYIEDKHSSEFSESFKKTLAKKIIDEHMNDDNIDNFLKECAYMFGNSIYLYTCDECGYNVYAHKLEV